MELLSWQDKLAQLDSRDASGKNELFQYDELSDHFQARPFVALVSLPPTQQLS